MIRRSTFSTNQSALLSFLDSQARGCCSFAPSPSSRKAKLIFAQRLFNYSRSLPIMRLHPSGAAHSHTHLCVYTARRTHSFDISPISYFACVCEWILLRRCNFKLIKSLSGVPASDLNYHSLVGVFLRIHAGTAYREELKCGKEKKSAECFHSRKKCPLVFSRANQKRWLVFTLRRFTKTQSTFERCKIDSFPYFWTHKWRFLTFNLIYSKIFWECAVQFFDATPNYAIINWKINAQVL